jgi:hypothetical protein
MGDFLQPRLPGYYLFCQHHWMHCWWQFLIFWNKIESLSWYYVYLLLKVDHMGWSWVVLKRLSLLNTEINTISMRYDLVKDGGLKEFCFFSLSAYDDFSFNWKCTILLSGSFWQRSFASSWIFVGRIWQDSFPIPLRSQLLHSWEKESPIRC